MDRVTPMRPMKETTKSAGQLQEEAEAQLRIDAEVHGLRPYHEKYVASAKKLAAGGKWTAADEADLWDTLQRLRRAKTDFLADVERLRQLSALQPKEKGLDEKIEKAEADAKAASDNVGKAHEAVAAAKLARGEANHKRNEVTGIRLGINRLKQESPWIFGDFAALVKDRCADEARSQRRERGNF